jgi:hypothetical protein
LIEDKPKTIQITGIEFEFESEITLRNMYPVEEKQHRGE